jgi:predicted dehydrogenase
VLVEAFHYRYHPLAARLKAILESGEIGQIQRIETEFCVPLLDPRRIQFRYDLGGGATMDVGCYAVNLMRFLAGAEPYVAHARARLIRPQIDRLMTAEFRFDDGRTGRITCALLSARLLRASASVYGTSGELCVTFPFQPHYFHRLSVYSSGTTRHEQLEGETTYFYQLQAFARAAQGGAPAQTDPVDAIANMRVIDAIYRAAGLRPRGLV